MVRPRKEPIVVSAENKLDDLREKYSRRELMQLFGAGVASAAAGCGGGGGEASPTATPGGGQETPTATEEEGGTPTTEGGRSFEKVDTVLQDVTGFNIEQFNPNPWNAETGDNPAYQRFELGTITIVKVSEATIDGALDAVFPTSARKFELSQEDSTMTIHLHPDITWGDGSDFNVENLKMHWQILKSQFDLGQLGESRLPISIEAEDEHTAKCTMVPGNISIRFFETMYQGRFGNVGNTHPKLHKKYVEALRDATTQNEIKTELQKLTSATFPKSDTPKMALGPFKASEWDPNKMVFDARDDFPWGLDYHPELSRIFKGLRWKSVGEEVNIVNAAASGKKDWVPALGSRDAFQRFPKDTWARFETTTPISSVFYFGNKNGWMEKTEKARKMRKAVAYHFDPKQMAEVNSLNPADEKTTGYTRMKDLKDWVGADTFSEFTNYGTKNNGWTKPDKGDEMFRAAGFEKNKNGVWMDDGEPRAPDVLLALNATATGSWGLTRPVVNNIVEQLNDMGLKASGRIPSDEKYDTDIENPSSFDMGFVWNNTEVAPHPYIAAREDFGLGSHDGLPAGFYSSDWRNGYRRVQVPMPIGNQDGKLQTIDWDKNALQMAETTSAEKMREITKLLAWTNNQWVPGVFTTTLEIYTVINTDRIALADDFNPVMWRQPNYQLGGGFWRPP